MAHPVRTDRHVLQRLSHLVMGRAYTDRDSPRSRQLRAMYAGGHGNAVAKAFARLWAVGFGLGLWAPRWVTLEVRGRKSGELRRFPLGMADLDDRWYLVSMLGECAWTRNVRAADGEAVLRRGRARRVHLTELPVDERAPVLRRYLDVVPGGRPHIPVPVGAPLAEFERIAPTYPVFRVEYLD